MPGGTCTYHHHQNRPQLTTIAALLLFSLGTLTHITAGGANWTDNPKLLLISLNGLRWDYITRTPADMIPNLHFFASHGVRLEWVKNIFPTRTMPNHMTLLTGTYPGTHGVVDDNFYDPLWKETFSMSNYTQSFDSKWFDAGPEPIWVTNKRWGHGRASGSVMFPCTQAPVKNTSVDRIYGSPFNSSIPYYHRVDKIIEWFSDPDKPINLGFLYFGEPDAVGRRLGPSVHSVMDTIMQLDNVLGYLRQKLSQRGLKASLNILLVSGHGLSPFNDRKVINLDHYAKPHMYKPAIISNEAMVFLRPKNSITTVYRYLKGKHHHLQVYLKRSSYLRKKHLSASRRVSDIVLVADDGWWIVSNSSISQPHLMNGGNGYDESVSDMHPFFIGYGPGFKKGLLSNPCSIVDFYPLMCHLLGLVPAPNNGSLDSVKHLLDTKTVLDGTFLVTVVTYVAAITLSTFVAGLYSIVVVRHYHRMPRQMPWSAHSSALQRNEPSESVHRLLNSFDNDDEDEL